MLVRPVGYLVLRPLGTSCGSNLVLRHNVIGILGCSAQCPHHEWAGASYMLKWTDGIDCMLLTPIGITCMCNLVL